MLESYYYIYFVYELFCIRLRYSLMTEKFKNNIANFILIVCDTTQVKASWDAIIEEINQSCEYDNNL